MKGALLMREAGGTPVQIRYVAFDSGTCGASDLSTNRISEPPHG